MLQTVWNGLVQGALYAVVALGYTMVYGILQLINFAHGEVLMLGAYTGVATLAGCAGSGALARFGLVPCLVAATLSSMLVTAAYGVAIERAAYRPLRNAPSLSALISAIGVSIVLQNFVMVGVGSAPVYAPTTHPELARLVSGTSWEVGGLSIPPLDLVILGACVVLMGGLWLFVQRTRLGTAMRATSQDRTMASLVGIDVNRVISVTFGIGSALAAVAGLLVTLVTSQAKYDMGFLMGMKAFTAAVLGGIGNVPGAMLGGIVLGLAEAIGVDRFGSDYQHVYSFLVLLVVLVFRPKGILGERVAEKV